jgi:hypothetical protein
MTVAIMGTETRNRQGAFTRRSAVFAAALIVLFGVFQLLTSWVEPDPAFRAVWLEDLTAQVVAGVLAAAVVVPVGRWVAGREWHAQVRGVIGLAAGATVLGPLVWWSAAPAILAAGAVVLGQVTGVTAREGGAGAARLLALLAALVAATTVVVIVVSIAVKQF